MPHEIDRILHAVASRPWAIDPDKAEEILGFLALCAAGHRPGWAAEPQPAVYAAEPARGRAGPVHVLRLHGSIFPRAGMLASFSGGASLERFSEVFMQAAEDESASAIVLDIDSPGGAVDLVPETAAMVRGARREGRPIVAVANTMMASAAYWIGSAADEVAVTPSGQVGSIGVYRVHQDMTGALEKQGVKARLIRAGVRKAEGHPALPLDDAAASAMQASVDRTYEMFVRDVARHRGVDRSVVRADPESADRHMGGGRAYGAAEAVRLGMADRVATLDETVRRLARGSTAPRAEMARRRQRMR